MNICGLCESDNVFVLHNGTRDRSDINVMKCGSCGLVFLSSIVIDDSFYLDSQMRGTIDFEQWRKNTYIDDNRRFTQYKELIKGKSILDFGCGNGGFLELATRQGKTRQIVGIDLDAEAVKNIKNIGIECYANLSELPDVKFDIVFLFHVIEHLPNPETILRTLFEHVTDGEMIIIETPNADDALLSIYGCEAFADFTYWSPHVRLYNESTLTKLLVNAGFQLIDMKQEQRYPLANHLYWLSKGLPGDGISKFTQLNNTDLNLSYARTLSKLKACDTITCTIRKSS